MLKVNELHWFPMRVRHSSIPRLERLKERLDRQEDIVETYVPTAFLKVNAHKMAFAPVIVNYIFVRATYTGLLGVKSNQELFEPLRFTMHRVYDESYNCSDEVLYISDKRMDDFMRVTASENEKVIFLDNLNYAFRPSQGVQITDGQFAGVIGRIKRIKGNRCVVIPVGMELAVAVCDVPRAHLRYLTPDEIAEAEQDQ